MKIGVIGGFNQRTSPELIATAGRLAEERGFHTFWVPEHVVFFPEYASRYPYSEDGRLPGNPDGVLEPFTALAFLAAHTQTIRLGTGICLVPQRNPVYTAKQVADVDFLSGGRVDFGIGLGWLREEFGALGVPWENRADRTRECLDVMKTLWCDEVSHHEGELYSLPNCLQNPKPVQKPHPPIFFGGEGDPALRRVADTGQGWFGFGLTPERTAERLQRLDALLAERGRSRAELRIAISPGRDAMDPASIPRFEELGVEQLVVPFGGRDADSFERRADRLAALVG